MIMWNIVNENVDVEIEMGPVTILKGSEETWFELVRTINDFFTNKSSEVQIFEDTLLVHKKDWECLFIPFDAHLQFDKINSKSPLKILLDEMSEELSYSPVFHELLSLWEELQEELDLINPKIDKYGLTLKMESFSIDHLKDFLLFTAAKKIMIPIEYKTMLLNLFTDKVSDKKRLIIIELPELYASDRQYHEFIETLNQLAKRGIHFVIVTQNQCEGNINYIFDGKIINDALLENMKRKIMSEVPFYCEDEVYAEAKSYLIRLVDNIISHTGQIGLSTTENEATLVVLKAMAKHLDINISLDITGVSPNLQAYLKTC